MRLEARRGEGRPSEGGEMRRSQRAQAAQTKHLLTNERRGLGCPLCALCVPTRPQRAARAGQARCTAVKCTQHAHASHTSPPLAQFALPAPPLPSPSPSPVPNVTRASAHCAEVLTPPPAMAGFARHTAIGVAPGGREAAQAQGAQGEAPGRARADLVEDEVGGLVEALELADDVPPVIGDDRDDSAHQRLEHRRGAHLAARRQQPRPRPPHTPRRPPRCTAGVAPRGAARRTPPRPLSRRASVTAAPPPARAVACKSPSAAGNKSAA